MKDELAIKFLGVGNAQSKGLGTSSCVLEKNNLPILLIDCGPQTLFEYRNCYSENNPPALFITHAHFDHVGGLESWFYHLIPKLNKGHCENMPKLFVPVDLVNTLQRRIADYPNMMAEGGVNFWDAFQLIPASERFWLNNMLFDVFPVRHHEHTTAFGIALQGNFLFTGDTRPIPEVLIHYASRGETIFHDCGLEENPSHTALSDIHREYSPQQWKRMIFYHYGSEEEGNIIEESGFKIAKVNDRFSFTHSSSTSGNANNNENQCLSAVS